MNPVALLVFRLRLAVALRAAWAALLRGLAWLLWHLPGYAAWCHYRALAPQRRIDQYHGREGVHVIPPHVAREMAKRAGLPLPDTLREGPP